MVVLDVVEEMLLQLPLKDLLRCKSICKSWYSLISSPSFVKTHLKFVSNKEDITTRIAMDESSIIYTEGWSMEGSSNGLVCIYKEDSNRIIVTNPSTGECREIQQPPKRIHKGRRCLGFGYDSSTDDYKVVMAICKSDITHVHILSLKSNIWKYFGQINYRFGDRRFDIDDSPLATPGILFNGALHWFWHPPNDTWKASLVSFDLAKEEFREIPQPDNSSGNPGITKKKKKKKYVWNYQYSLGIIEGSQYIFIQTRYDVDDSSDRIWVMQNCNGKPSWELLPITNYCKMKGLAIHYMLKDSNDYRIPTYYCDDDIEFSWYETYISSPIFVQTLVSPYVNNNNGIPSCTKNNKSIVSTRRPSHTKNNKSTINNGRPSHADNNKSSVKAWRVKEKRETKEDEKGVVTNTYKNGSKNKERLLKSFRKKKERVE